MGSNWRTFRFRGKQRLEEDIMSRRDVIKWDDRDEDRSFIETPSRVKRETVEWGIGKAAEESKYWIGLGSSFGRPVCFHSHGLKLTTDPDLALMPFLAITEYAQVLLNRFGFISSLYVQGSTMSLVTYARQGIDYSLFCVSTTLLTTLQNKLERIYDNVRLTISAREEAIPGWEVGQKIEALDFQLRDDATRMFHEASSTDVGKSTSVVHVPAVLYSKINDTKNMIVDHSAIEQLLGLAEGELSAEDQTSLAQNILSLLTSLDNFCEPFNNFQLKKFDQEPEVVNQVRFNFQRGMGDFDAPFQTLGEDSDRVLTLARAPKEQNGSEHVILLFPTSGFVGVNLKRLLNDLKTKNFGEAKSYFQRNGYFENPVDLDV